MTSFKTFDCRTQATHDLVVSVSEQVWELLSEEATGHDWWHAQRVRNLALHIAKEEEANSLIVELACLMHDVEDYKFSGNDEAGPSAVSKILRERGVDDLLIEEINDVVRTISFNGANVPDQHVSIEARCVQDADRIDAIGAIGIARTFAYGGYVGRPIHDPSVPMVLANSVEEYRANLGTTINHFHEKLLLVHDRLSTMAGRVLAKQRHDFMLDFLKQFQDEWDFGVADGGDSV